jgi:hypothetical protein
MPHSIVSDRDPTFTNNFWQELFRLQGTQLYLIISYHPQNNGQTKVFNKFSETYLRFFASERKNQWAQWLPLVEWWYNMSYDTTTRMTPFQAVYGKNPPSFLSYMPGISKVQVVDQMFTAQEAILRTLKDNLVMSQNRMKKQKIKVAMNINLHKEIRCFFNCNLIRKIPSRLTIFRIGTQILWSLYHSQASGIGGLSVSFTHSF